jgi:DtxR family Mn-dependent transcriptional regulator
MKKKGISETEEDYLRVIYELSKEKGYATVSDVAGSLSVKPPSVTDMIKKLSERKYVIYEPYKPIILSEEGERIAKDVFDKHHVLTNFLTILGIEPDIAEEDACGIEHHLHKETSELLTKFVEFMQKAPREPRWLEHFNKYVETGELPDDMCRDTEEDS